jgi:hypothetical protein
VIPRHLVAFVELITGKNGARVTQVGSKAEVVVNENNQSATATVVSLLSPLSIGLDEGPSQG